MKQLEDVILVQIDCEKGKGVKLAKKYNKSPYAVAHVVVGGVGQ